MEKGLTPTMILESKLIEENEFIKEALPLYKVDEALKPFMVQDKLNSVN